MHPFLSRRHLHLIVSVETQLDEVRGSLISGSISSKPAQSVQVACCKYREVKPLTRPDLHS